MRQAGFSSPAWLLPLLASCGVPGSSAPLFSVAELDPRIDELNGKTVRVVGYLENCGGYDCTLHRQKSDAEAMARFFEEMRQDKRPALPDFPQVGIGSGERFEFDAKAAPFEHSYVVITGKVTNECRYKGERGCTDRSPDLDPTDIVAWTGPVPPPPQLPNRPAP